MPTPVIKLDHIPSYNTLELVLGKLLGSSWRASASTSPIDDGYVIALRAAEYAAIPLTGIDMAKYGQDRHRLVELLYGRAKTAQASIIDALDKSVGRPARIEDKPPPGCCDFCGAPYGLKVKP